MSGEWIEYNGKGCPVDAGVHVFVTLRGGEHSDRIAKHFDWHWDGSADDITAYRVVEEPKTSAIEDIKTKDSIFLKDSGERRETGTGAVRDRASGKGRFDLIPLQGMLLCAQQMEAGAAKYSERNWEKGMPLSWFADSAQRHLGKFIAGYDDEPHLSAAIWNLMCLAEGQERIRQDMWPKEFDDLPHTYAGKSPNF